MPAGRRRRLLLRAGDHGRQRRRYKQAETSGPPGSAPRAVGGQLGSLLPEVRLTVGKPPFACSHVPSDPACACLVLVVKRLWILGGLDHSGGACLLYSQSKFLRREDEHSIPFASLNRRPERSRGHRGAQKTSRFRALRDASAFRSRHSLELSKDFAGPCEKVRRKCRYRLRQSDLQISFLFS